MNRSVKALVFVMTGLLLASCARIPTSGSVQVVEQTDTKADTSTTVRYRPASPSDGASPEDIVSGYFDSMLAFPVDGSIVSEYLTDAAARTWSNATGMVIYNGAPSIGTATQTATGWTVDATFHQVAHLDQQGRYTRDDSLRTVTLNLENVDGQWRVADPPNGLLVPDYWMTDYMRPFSLYFLDASATEVVPVPVWAVAGDRTSSALMVSLAIGTAPPDNPTLLTAVPAGVGSSVPVSAAGIAEISIPGASSMDVAKQELLFAQVAWTLRSVAGVEGFQVRDGDVLLSPRGSDSGDFETWDDFAPQASDEVVAVSSTGTRLVTSSTTSQLSSVDKLAPPNQTSSVGSGTSLIALNTAATTVVTDRFGHQRASVPVVNALAPCVGPAEEVWILDQPGDFRARIFESGVISSVDTSALAGASVTAWSLSPDGSRYAAVRNGVLVVGDVVKSPEGILVLAAPTVLDARASTVLDVTWYSGTMVTVLVSDGSGRGIVSIRIDGSQYASPVPASRVSFRDGKPVSVLVKDGSLYVLDDQQRFWVLEGSTWSQIPVDGVRAIG